MLLSALAGAGFEKVANGINKLSQSGQDISTIFNLPNMPIFLAGAGLKDAANSLELTQPLLEGLQPPSPPEQPDPQQLSAAIQMLSARLGPGMSGIQPPQMPGLPGGF